MARNQRGTYEFYRHPLQKLERTKEKKGIVKTETTALTESLQQKTIE